MDRRILLAFVACGTLMALGVQPAAAQAWPQRGVKFILPLGPGSGVDIGARLRRMWS